MCGSVFLWDPCAALLPVRSGKKQRNTASSFCVSVSNQYFFYQRLIGLLTLWQKCNNIRHREHSEVRKSSQPVRLNHPFTPIRILSIKQNPNTFSLPTHPSTQKSSSGGNSARCVCVAHAAPLGEQGWNLRMTKAEVGCAQGHRDVGQLSALSQLQQNHKSQVSHRHPRLHRIAPYSTQNTTAVQLVSNGKA